LTDPGCVGIAGGASELAPGESTKFTCMHTITSTTPYMNVASIEGTPPPGQGGPIGRESNQVLVNAIEPKNGGLPAKCAALAGKFVLKGATGPKRHKFTVKISSKGIKSVTFYLDGRKIKTLPASAAKRTAKKHAAAKRAAAKNFFTITVDPAKLKFGPHTVSVTAELNDPQCGPIKLTTVFVHPRTGSRVVKFTG
jgi:hypothetical protein